MLKQPDGTQLHKSAMMRHYIVGLRYRHPGEAFPIPSSRELAEMFGIARSTVTLELKAMTEDGIIIGKRGIGTFTNPMLEYIFPQGQKALPLIGLLCGDGRMFFHDSYSWNLISQIGQELTLRQCNVNYITGSFKCSSAEEIVTNFKRLGLNAVIWSLPPPQIGEIAKRLKASGIALLTGEKQVPGFSGTGYDIAQYSRRLAEHLLKEKRHSIAILPSHDFTQEIECTISDVYRAAGEELELPAMFTVRPEKSLNCSVIFGFLRSRIWRISSGIFMKAKFRMPYMRMASVRFRRTRRLPPTGYHRNDAG